MMMMMMMIPLAVKRLALSNDDLCFFISLSGDIIVGDAVLGRMIDFVGLSDDVNIGPCIISLVALLSILSVSIFVLMFFIRFLTLSFSFRQSLKLTAIIEPLAALSLPLPTYTR